MEQEQDYFNLEQVAYVCSQSVEAIKAVIFEGDFLKPSHQLQRPIRANLFIEKLQTPPDNTDYYDICETVPHESNASVTGFVDIYDCSRHSGKFDGKIELHPDHRRILVVLDSFLIRPSLYHWTHSGLRVKLELLEPCEISEDKMIVRREEVERFIHNDHDSIERYEQLCALGVNAAMLESTWRSMLTQKETTPAAEQTENEHAMEFNLQEVIPIRFIEFYTGGKLGPETTSLLFAHKQGIDWNRRMEAADKLTAYHWQHGKAIPIKRTEWESILHSIKSLSERYDKTDKHFDEWRTAALQILPVAFVRRSEFDAAYHRAMSTERITFVDQSRGFKRLTGVEDKEARETNDTPYIPPELRKIVVEGFEQECTTISTEATEQDHFPECSQMPEIYNPASEAAKALKQRQTAEIDKKVDEIMGRIYCFVKEVSQNRSVDRVINHIKFIREAGIPEEKFVSVKKKVAARIKSDYGHAGFTSLSRRPKANEPYLLSK